MLSANKLRTRSGVVMTVAVIVICVAAGYSFLSLRDERGAVSSTTQIFLTTDDGLTFFAAPADQLPPVQLDGKTAYQAHVFACRDDRWVGYLERYTPEGKKKAIAMIELRSKPGTPAFMPFQLDGIEIKKPGSSTWVKQSDIRQAADVMNVRCRKDPSMSASPVLP